MRSQGSGRSMAIIILLITAAWLSSGAVALSEETGESMKGMHVLSHRPWNEFNIFTVALPGRCKCKHMLAVPKWAEEAERCQHREATEVIGGSGCDSCLSECLTPILAEFAINTGFCVEPQRSMDLPERMNSIFSGSFHSWKTDPAPKGCAHVRVRVVQVPLVAS